MHATFSGVYYSDNICHILCTRAHQCEYPCDYLVEIYLRYELQSQTPWNCLHIHNKLTNENNDIDSAGVCTGQYSLMWVLIQITGSVGYFRPDYWCTCFQVNMYTGRTGKRL